METTRYHLRAAWSAVDEAFLATVDEFPALHYYAESRPEALNWNRELAERTCRTSSGRVSAAVAAG
jgi:hypothetical protein